MLRLLAIVPLLGALVLLPPAQTSAVPPLVTLAGEYENISSGGYASVARDGRGYLFTNEHGAQAKFVFTGRNRLEMEWGEWAPTVVTVGQDRFGRTLLRFDSNGRPGFWLRSS